MLKKDDKKQMLSQMLRIRSFEERVGELFLKGGTAGTMLHLSIGEEAAAVGVAEAMQDGDSFTTHHRGHGIFMARGADPKRMMAEIAGKSAGYCKGKGGSMHIADMSLGHLGANAIVGGGISHVVGAALSYKTLKKNNVSVAFFGDGAMQQGVLYESFNLAALWNLPAMFVCINNQYGMGTRVDRSASNTDFVGRARAYGLEAELADGANVEEVLVKAEALLATARKGKPAFLVIECYRFYGHARKDKSPYRSEIEEEQGRKKDPIAHYIKRLTKEKIITGKELSELKKSIDQEMDTALEFAENAEKPSLQSMFDDVYDPNSDKPISNVQRLGL